ncbi:hypothetical protein [Candidatus Thiosymbion oneisti]|uniref:hypothetical protein n=1 Tax=Candidatus Thiosymbion oneisti TaxID=589554 RepID=UPI000B0954C5|nr:hypothetical protein [Candidatus Thiosymbion oneisti]
MNLVKRLLPALSITLASAAYPLDWSGNLAVEARIFPSAARWSEQKNSGLSLSFQPELRHQWHDGKRGLTFIPFLRIDSTDEERTHADIREFKYLHVADGWEIRAGIDKVFWGVTESQHLVDIVNQTDLIENIDGEDKLGQPMVRVTRVLGNGAIDLFLLPWFRERTFPGAEGRLRTPLVVDTDRARYESDLEQRHFDYALRWNQTIGPVDAALSWFHGTARAPDLVPDTQAGATQNGASGLIPYYPLLRQAGLEFQYTGEAWLWKLEAVHRETKGKDYRAAVGGFEYTFVGIHDTQLDLGVLAEYNYDSRRLDASSPFQNDLFIGTRLTFNDTQSSELLAGGFFDLDYHSRSFRVEASRRIGQSYKLSVEGQLFLDMASRDPLAAFAADDFIRIELTRYF